MENNLYKIFVISVIIYQCIFYFLPLPINYFLFNERNLFDDSFFYPLLYIILIIFFAWFISKIKVKKFHFKQPNGNYSMLLFFTWVIVNLILIITDNISMAFNSGKEIPLLSQLKFYSSQGIIFNFYFCQKFLSKKISFWSFLIFLSVIMYFTFLTLSKMLIFSNILLTLIFFYRKIRFKWVMVPMIFIFFLPVYNFLVDYRSSLSNQVDLSIIQDQRASVVSENPFADFIIDRLNYFKILKSSIETNYYFEDNPYLSNFYGLIPRIIYPSKPNIGVDTNKLGREIMLLSQEDYNTSLGIGVISESYIYLRYNGILTTLFFAFMFYLFKAFNDIPFKLMSIFTFTILDTFSVFLPTLIMLILYSIIFRTLKFE